MRVRQLPCFLFLAFTLLGASFSPAQSAALLTVQGQGMAPNQSVTLSTGPKQNISLKASANGSVSFGNLKYAPDNNLSFILSYQVKGTGNKAISNNVLISLDPFTGTVALRGTATKAASIIVNVSSEDSSVLIANQDGHFSGSARSITGLSEGQFRATASIVNVEENCCPRSMRPFAPVAITVTSQPEKRAAAEIIESFKTTRIDVSLPPLSYGVSVPDDMIKKSWITGAHQLGNQINQAIQRQTTIIGSFFQSQAHIGSARSIQEGQAKAAVNYLPSEQLCRYGSLSLGLAATDMATTSNQMALASSLQDNEMKSMNSLNSSKNPNQTAMGSFRTTNCDPTTGNLSLDCRKNTNDTRYNKDVDYATAIDAPMTLDVDFAQSSASAVSSDVLSMAENLFPSKPAAKGPEQEGYMNNNSRFRSVQAIRSVAKNTFVTQVAEKAKGTAGSYKFMNSLMRSLGLSDTNAKTLLGENPSYYAQMEVLTKKIFQAPAFYINLVDTPSNVKRQKAAIQAVKLQQQNDFAQVVKRREMLLAVLLEMKIRERENMVKQRLNPKTDTAQP